jgi:hypothetical protein
LVYTQCKGKLNRKKNSTFQETSHKKKITMGKAKYAYIVEVKIHLSKNLMSKFFFYIFKCV